VNTRFGHLVGDKILSDVAGLLKKTFRASDTVIRYGGDEFLVLMDDTDEPAAKPALDRLQSLVQAWNLTNPMTGYKLGVSCGVATYSKGANIQEVLETADDRMYHSKLRMATAEAG
jgi:diguanylate cyclase (GGDEF)-like protein